MTVMSFIILVVTLIGVAMLIGPGLVNAILTGIAGIDFVDNPFVIVFAIVEILFLVFCIAWSIIAKHPKYAVMRYISWGAWALITFVYVIFVCSMWADSWSATYIEFLSKYESILQDVAQGGRLLIFFGLGWGCRFLFEKYIVQRKAETEVENGN